MREGIKIQQRFTRENFSKDQRKEKKKKKKKKKALRKKIKNLQGRLGPVGITVKYINANPVILGTRFPG